MMEVIIRNLYYQKNIVIDFIREMERCEFVFQIVSGRFIRDDQRDLLDLTCA